MSVLRSKEKISSISVIFAFAGVVGSERKIFCPPVAKIPFPVLQNYDAVDGCVNLQKENPGKALVDDEKRPKKRESVVKKLREKQIAIAKRTGRPIPKYLEQQMVREKV